MIEFFTWWLLTQAIGLAALPIAWRLFKNLPDRGYAFARPLGLLLSSYLLWILVTFGFLRNERVTIAVLIVVLGAAAWLAVDRRALLGFLRDHRATVIATEVLFFVAFAGWTFFRSYNPEIAGTEKPMELAFLSSILRTGTFPPPDPWLSGFAISYYYFGYLMVGLLAKLSGITAPVAFNLAIPLLFAWTCTGAFSVVYNLIVVRNPQFEIRGLSFGLLGPLFVAIVGNLEGLLEVLHTRGVGSAGFWQWLDIKDLSTPAVATGSWLPDRFWWWWRASRVVHDVILGQDSEVIDEFPFFSFMLGDLHPHVLALPFVLMALALAFNVLNEIRISKFEIRNLASDFLLVPLILGALGFLNSWDFPTYSLIFVGAYAIRRRLEQGQFDRDWWRDVVMVGLLVLGLGLLLYLPFYVGFQSQAGGIRPVLLVKTRWQQYLVMFGLFVWINASFLLWQLRSWAQAAGRMGWLTSETWWVGGIALPLVAVSVLFRWWTAALLFVIVAVAMLLILQKMRLASPPPAPAEGEPETIQRPTPVISSNPTLTTLFVLLLIAAGFALTLATEFVYIKDLFNSRMNTVFKFYFQAWILLAIAAAYGVYWLIGRVSSLTPTLSQTERERSPLPKGEGLGVSRVAWTGVTGVLIAAGLIYSLGATWTKANGFNGSATLDGLAFFKQARPADYDAIQWLDANVSSSPAGVAEGPPVVLQASGGSYSDAGWIAAATGFPTLLGWEFHEQQWRGNFDEPARRQPVIQQIYQSTDVQAVRKLLDEWQVEYVYVGPVERDRYNLSQPQIDKFGRFMDKVYDRAGVVIYRKR